MLGEKVVDLPFMLARGPESCWRNSSKLAHTACLTADSGTGRTIVHNSSKAASRPLAWAMASPSMSSHAWAITPLVKAMLSSSSSSLSWSLSSSSSSSSLFGSEGEFCGGEAAGLLVVLVLLLFVGASAGAGVGLAT